MNSDIKMVYGMSSTRVDEDIVDEVMDALDDLMEEEWDVLSWRRSSATRFVIRSSVVCRAIQSDSELKIRILPLGAVLEDMSDSRNEWLVPKRVQDGTPYEMARRTVDKWSKNLWPDEIEEMSNQPARGDDEGTKRAEKPRLVSVVKKNPEEDVFKAFGLTGKETDQEGVPFGLVNFDTVEEGDEEQQE